MLDNQEGANSVTYRTTRFRKAFFRRDVSNADLFGTDTIPTAVEISSMETSAQGGVIYTVIVYGIHSIFQLASPPGFHVTHIPKGNLAIKTKRKFPVGRRRSLSGF